MPMAPPAPPTLDTFPKLLLHNAANWPRDVALREKELGIWREHGWAQCRDAVRLAALGLAGLGLRRGEVVALIGRNRPGWVWGQLAAHCLGCSTLGLYEDVLVEEAAYLVGFTRVAIAFCEDQEQVDKLLALGEAGGSLRHIVYRDERGLGRYRDPRLISWAALAARGAELLAREPTRFEAEIARGHGQDVAILCPTSGTTARPKLAMLQFGPLLDHVGAYLRADPRGAGDEYVSILPLPWIMEQIYVVAMPLLCRVRVSFPEGHATAMRDLREIGPTHLLLAPRVWEATVAELRARLMDAGPLTRALFAWAVRVGTAAVAQGRRHRLADLVMFSALRDRLGFSRLRSAATGGAALGPDTFRFLLALGVPLRQLYGQTEAAGAYTLQAPDDLDCDSSGLPFDDTEIAIRSPDEHGMGEILVRHPGLFLGYFGQDAATREAMDQAGWLRTGDAGLIDGTGALKVIDRVKDLAVTALGVRFSPQFIENKLKFSPFIGECVVIGHDRPYLVAILCIRYATVAKWAEARSLGFTSYQDLAARPEVLDLLAAEVETVNAGLDEPRRLRRFLALYKELDADDGELTRTRKLRRAAIDQRHARLIEALYQEAGEVRVAGEITFENGRKGRIEAALSLRTTRAGVPGRPRAAA
ncbi:MAG: AMP-binding protein [Geminicoccaceae bacterium]